MEFLEAAALAPISKFPSAVRGSLRSHDYNEDRTTVENNESQEIMKEHQKLSPENVLLRFNHNYQKDLDR